VWKKSVWPCERTGVNKGRGGDEGDVERGLITEGGVIIERKKRAAVTTSRCGLGGR